MTSLSGKSYLVTGGASGIGRAVSMRLAASGAHVAVADINLSGAQTTCDKLATKGVALALDVRDPSSWRVTVSETVSALGGLDGLVNCAGIGVNGSFEELTLEDWNAMLAVNLTGVFLGCQAVIPEIAAGGGGAIVNISSIGGLVGGGDIAGYCATKGGVTMLTKSVALYCAEKGNGVRACAVAPTYVDTEMLDPVAEQHGDREALLAGMAELVPVGRVAKPEDIASVVAFLLSDDAQMITGSTTIVDGGQLAGIPSRHSKGG